LKCKALRATAIAERDDSFAATVLEVFEPDAEPPLACKRTISAANDGGTWRFSQSGPPFPFEDITAYRQRSIRERFTTTLLYRYLDRLKVPAFATKSLVDYSPLLLESGMVRDHGSRSPLTSVSLVKDWYSPPIRDTCGGVVSIKAHVFKRGGGYTLEDGLDADYFATLDAVFGALRRSYGESLWWGSMSDIAARVATGLQNELAREA
jgi:hypothetical protein